MKQINEKELHSIFEGISNKNETQFTKLYEQYHTLVYAIAFSMLKNKHDSEDVMQKVFLKIWKMDKAKLPTKSEASWLYSVTKNETINYIKGQKQEQNLEDIYYISEEDTELNAILEQDVYNKLIAKLSPKEQEILSLKILSNLSFKQISQILHIPMGTVQWKYYTSIHTLKILFTNLSMFMLTISVWMIAKTKDRKKAANLEKIEQKEDTIKEPEAAKTQEDSVENARQEGTEQANETIENVIIQEEYEPNVEPIEIGIISIASIFFIFTISFFIIFLKHQQKAKRKLSKR